MSDYSPVNDFSAKDSLGTGEAEKLILGSDMDAETAALQTAINSKFDSDDFASQAEAEAGTNTAKLMHPLRAEQHLAAYLAEGAAMVADLKAIADPGADRIYFWDDSDNALEFLTLGNGLAITTNDLAWSASGITGHDTFSDFVSDEHVAHGGVSVVAGAGMTGGGTIAASRTLNVIGGTGITANADDIEVDFASAAETLTGTEAAKAITPVTLKLATRLGFIKTSQETVTNSNTLQNDDALVVSLEANTWYALEMFIACDSDSDTPDIRIALSFSESVQDTGGWSSVARDNASLHEAEGDLLCGAQLVHSIVSRETFISVQGSFFTNASTGGTVRFQWAQNTSNGTATKVDPGSWIRCIPL